MLFRSKKLDAMLHGQVSYGMASSFLRELPEGLLHWITPRIAQRNSFVASYLTPNPSQPPPLRQAQDRLVRGGEPAFPLTRGGRGGLISATNEPSQTLPHPKLAGTRQRQSLADYKAGWRERRAL